MINRIDQNNNLGKITEVKIDRPMGSQHPTDGFLYPLNYGYIEGVLAPDGEDLDAYILGVFEPLERFTGKCIAILHRLNDDDDKLIIAPDGEEYSKDQIRALIEFQERFFKSVIFMDNS